MELVSMLVSVFIGAASKLVLSAVNKAMKCNQKCPELSAYARSILDMIREIKKDPGLINKPDIRRVLGSLDKALREALHVAKSYQESGWVKKLWLLLGSMMKAGDKLDEMKRKIDQWLQVLKVQLSVQKPSVGANAAGGSKSKEKLVSCRGDKQKPKGSKNNHSNARRKPMKEEGKRKSTSDNSNSNSSKSKQKAKCDKGTSKPRVKKQISHSAEVKRTKERVSSN